MMRTIHAESYLETENRVTYFSPHLHPFLPLLTSFAKAIGLSSFLQSIYSSERNMAQHSKQAIRTHQQQTQKEEYVSALTILMSSKGLPLSFITRVRSMSFTTL